MLIKDNSYIPSEDKDFFILLRVGLWQRVEEELSLCPNWAYIYQLACEQTVQGIIADGIGIYRKEHPNLNISQEQNDKFLSASAQIVRQNFKVNQVLLSLSKVFDEQHIKYVILKGQVVAQCYPKPMLRCSGDIDFLIPSEDCDDFERANKMMTATCPKTDYYLEQQRQQKYFVDDIAVEIHGRALSLISQRLDDTVEDERKEMFKNNKGFGLQVSESTINAPSLEYHTFFIYCHILKHIFENGVGLRQISDLAMFMTHNRDKIDFNHLESLITESGTQRWWNMISRFISTYLSGEFQDPCFKKKVFELPQSYTKTIWKNCKKSGNMGHKDQEEEAEAREEFITRNIYSFKKAHIRAKKLMAFSPMLAFNTLIDYYTTYISWAFQKVFGIGGMKFNK